MTFLSVIVPTLNESDLLPQTLGRIVHESGIGEVELIVVDGGSTDATPALAQRFGVLLQGPRGRAKQFNLGAERATGRVIFFCHADSLPPLRYGKLIREALSVPSVVAGSFAPDYFPPHALLRLVSLLLTSASPYLMFGDAGLFLRAGTFRGINGYPEVPLMEDVALVKLLRREGRFVRLRQVIRTSSRRFFETGVVSQLSLDVQLLVLHHLFHHDLHRLADRYHVTSRDSDLASNIP